MEITAAPILSASRWVKGEVLDAGITLAAIGVRVSPSGPASLIGGGRGEL